MQRLGLLSLALTVALAGCATTSKLDPRTGDVAGGIDVTGRWAGTWIGYGIADTPRKESAIFELKQKGERGTGRVLLDNVGAAEPVPVALRYAGAVGIPVNLAISGSHVSITHELGPRLFAADLIVTEDRMVGRIRHANPTVEIILTRVNPTLQTAAVTPPSATAPVASPPPREPATPAAAAAEPPKTEVVAALPAPAPTLPAADAPARPASKQSALGAEMKTIYFEFDKADLRPSEISTLDANAQWLQSNADLQVTIEGHGDERGTNEYNLALGDRRAKAARDYLVSRGVQAERITTISYGEEQPICSERTTDCFTRNRRAGFVTKPR